jgi:hypothetical protein
MPGGISSLPDLLTGQIRVPRRNYTSRVARDSFHHVAAHPPGDENITSSDMTMLIAFKPKVNLSYIMIIFSKFDELMLRHDVCSLSFSKIHTWIKKSTKHTWKTWRTEEVDWGRSPSVPHVLHQTSMSLLAQRWKEIKANTFWVLDSDCMTGPTCNGCHDLIRTRFGTFFIWLERKFHRAFNGTGLMSKSYMRRRESSKQVDILNLSGCCATDFWAIGPCIVSEPMRARPRVGARTPPINRALITN